MAYNENKTSGNKLRIVTRSGTSPQIVSLLENTVFGTEGKIRYRQNGIAQRMNSQQNLQFIQIVKGDRLLGTTGIISRETKTAGQTLQTLYIRYLSVYNPFRKKTDQKSTPRSTSRNTRLQTLITEQLTYYFEKPVIDNNHQSAFYAFVESENVNSRNLCIRMGFKPTRSVATFLFSRFFPKKSPDISKISESHYPEIRKKLSTFYSSHSFYFQDHVFSTGNYLIAIKKDQIIAGLRYRVVNWEIHDVPGLHGFLMRKVLPFLPFTRKLFNTDNFTFLAFDYLWYEKNYERKITELMEHACATENIRTGMCWQDLDSELHEYLSESGKLGFLHSVNGTVTADVMIRFINTDKEEQDLFLNHPVFVSALDMT